MTNTAQLAANTAGNVYVSNTGFVTVNASSAGASKTWQLFSSGNITLSGILTGDFITLQTTSGSNGNITIGAKVGNTTGTTTLTAGGSGALIQSGTAGLIQGAIVNLNSSTGNIGSLATPLLVSAGTVTITAGAGTSAYVTDAIAVTLNASSVAGTLQFISKAALTVSGILTANDINLQTIGAGAISQTAGSLEHPLSIWQAQAAALAR